MPRSGQKNNRGKSRSDNWRHHISKAHNVSRKSKKAVRTKNRGSQVDETTIQKMDCQIQDHKHGLGRLNIQGGRFVTTNFTDLEFNDVQLKEYFDHIGEEFDSTKDSMDNLRFLKETYKQLINTPLEERPGLHGSHGGRLAQSYRHISAILKQLERRGHVGVFKGHDKKSGKTHDKRSKSWDVTA